MSRNSIFQTSQVRNCPIHIIECNNFITAAIQIEQRRPNIPLIQQKLDNIPTILTNPIKCNIRNTRKSPICTQKVNLSLKSQITSHHPSQALPMNAYSAHIFNFLHIINQAFPIFEYILRCWLSTWAAISSIIPKHNVNTFAQVKINPLALFILFLWIFSLFI